MQYGCALAADLFTCAFRCALRFGQTHGDERAARCLAFEVVKDLPASLAERGVDLNLPRLRVIDGSKALRAAIEQKCGDAARDPLP